MDWVRGINVAVHGIKVASIIAGIAAAIGLATVGLFLTLGGWAFIPLGVMLFGAIVCVGAVRPPGAAGEG